MSFNMATNATPKPPKAGTSVSFTRKNGEKAVGVVHRYEDAANGSWVYVNTSDNRGKKVDEGRDCTRVRPSQLVI